MPGTAIKVKGQRAKGKGSRGRGSFRSPWSEAERAAWRLPEQLTVSQWADKYRMLDARSSAEPGQWHTERTPYARQPMDDFTDPEVEVIDLCFPPQSGKTEILLNCIGYVIDQDPAPAMLIQPRDEDCEYIAENRIKPMVHSSAALKRHLTGRPWDLKKAEFYFDMMTLYFAGSNSPAGLSSRPVRYLFRDEVNKWPPFVGKEADPIKLSEMRTVTFWDRKIVNCSTPTRKADYITASLDRSRAHELAWPCPFCQHYQYFKIIQLKPNPIDCHDPEVIRRTKDVFYECEHCGGKITEEKKPQLLANHVWCPDGCTVGAGGKLIGHPKRDRRHVGYHLNALASPWVPWWLILAEWFEANTAQGIMVGLLMAFKNQKLAEPWEETSKTVKVNELEQKRGEFSRGTAPDEALILVAGADYHEDTHGNKRIDYTVRAFGYELRNWIVSSGSVASFEGLEGELFQTPYPWSNPENKKTPLAVMLLCIDSGYEADTVYQFCYKWRGLALPTKGYDHQRSPIVTTSLQKTHGKFKGLLQLVNVDTTFFKDMVSRWADAPAGEPGATSYYAEIPQVYFTEFCNEHKVRSHDKFGRVVEKWETVSKGAPTHFLDADVLSAVAGYLKNVQYFHRKDGQRAALPEHYQRRSQKPEARSREGGFLGDLPRL